MLTPRMRMQFYQNARSLKPQELLEVKKMCESMAPAAVSDLPDGTGTKLDVEMIPMRAFVRMDAYMRNKIVARAS